MKIISKKIIPFVFFFALILTFSICYADGDGGTIGAEISKIADIMAALGVAISIMKLMQIGIKFMFGAGSKKSDAKASLIPWLVGLFVCALWFPLGNWIINDVLGGGGSGNGPFDV